MLEAVQQNVEEQSFSSGGAYPRSDVKPTHQNIYQNVVTGATPNPVMPNPDAIDEDIINNMNRILSNADEERL